MDMNSGMIIVRDQQNTYEEILIDIDYSSFSSDYEKNATRQLTFTAWRTPFNAFTFDLLAMESIIIYQGQQYVVKQCTPKVSGQLQTKDITAVHISFTIQDHYQYDAVTTSKTYTLDEFMQYAIGDNELGFTYEIIGNFESKTLQSINADNGLNSIKNIACDTFGAIFYADNKKIQLYSEDEWYREVQNTYRHLYNTSDTSVTEDTTNLKTVIKAYGKQKDETDTKSDETVSLSNVNYKGTWNNAKTSTKGATASFTFNGTGVDVYFKKDKYGGKVHIDVDGSNGKSGTTYSENGGAITLTIRGLDDKQHTCNIEFTGIDTKNPNTKKIKHEEPYTDTTKTGKIVRKTKITYTQEPATLELQDPVANIYKKNEGDDQYEAVVIYESPNVSTWGKRYADPVTNDDITNNDDLLAYAKTQIQDYPDLSLSTTYTGTELIDVRDVWMLIHELLGLSLDVKLVSLQSPHPYTHKSQSVTFSSARKDMIQLQTQLSRTVKETSKKISDIPKLINENLPATVTEASKAINAVTGKVEFDAERGIKTDRKQSIISQSTVSMMVTLEDDSSEDEEITGSIIFGNGSITAVNEEGDESDVITPDGIDLSTGYNSLSDEVIDDIVERLGLNDTPSNEDLQQVQMMKITADNGDVKKAFTNTDDLLIDLQSLGIGMHTFYAPVGILNNPISTRSTRGLAHFTSGTSTQATNGWVLAIDTASFLYMNYLINGTWVGWKTISTQDPPLWTNITLQNGTTVANSRPPRYTKTGSFVFLDGEFNGVSAGIVIGTLPSGYRPAVTKVFSVALNSTTLGEATITINNSGQIIVLSVSDNTKSVSLCGLNFTTN